MQDAVLTTYRAILRGNRLEWSGNERQHPPADRPMAVYVTVLDEPISEVDADEGQGARMAAALERLAEIHALAGVDDAAVWERETRRDRALPGRDS
jgi:hypothetical protein